MNEQIIVQGYVGSLDVELLFLDNPITYRALVAIIVDTYLEETLAFG